jgi:UPF0755 protein
MPPLREGGRPWLRILVGVVASLLVLTAGFGWWVNHQIHPGGAGGSQVTVTIKEGSSTAAIGSLLHTKGVIGNATLFRLYASLKGVGTLQSGQYSFRHHEDMGHVLSVLESGKAALVKVTIPEGSTLAQIADKVGRLRGMSAERFLGVARGGTVRSKFEPPGSSNLEGLIFPDTYFVAPGDDETKLLTRMVGAFDDMATQLGVQDAQARVGVTPYEAAIVASLIEREAKVDEDRAMIARVVYNRLQRKMTLGIDATVEYALGQHKQQLSNQDLNINSPYNTRKFPGLPPTPIAAPGRKALEAALAPTPGPWLYYVLADASGRHAFATNDAEFERLRREAHAKGLL